MIELRNVDFEYEPNHPILKNISLTIGNENEDVIGILGPNGSGKSTLFLNLVGILKPTKGQILVDGNPIKYHKKDLINLRQKVGIVFQDSDQQIFYSIVKDDIAFALHNLKLPQAEIDRRVNRVLKELDIEHIKERPVQYLSGGQKKRVAIAGIMVLESEWLLLDEPTAGLDPDGTKRMIELIKHLKANGQKIIVSSHDMDFMYEICNYFYIIKDGQVITQGDKANVFLDEELLTSSSLIQPWLVMLHQKMGLPLYNSKAEMLLDSKIDPKL